MNADVAQWIVRRGSNTGDAGSSPAVGTNELNGTGQRGRTRSQVVNPEDEEVWDGILTQPPDSKPVSSPAPVPQRR